MSLISSPVNKRLLTATATVKPAPETVDVATPPDGLTKSNSRRKVYMHLRNCMWRSLSQAAGIARTSLKPLYFRQRRRRSAPVFEEFLLKQGYFREQFRDMADKDENPTREWRGFPTRGSLLKWHFGRDHFWLLYYTTYWNWCDAVFNVIVVTFPVTSFYELSLQVLSSQLTYRSLKCQFLKQNLV